MSDLPTQLQKPIRTYVSFVGGGRKLAGLFPSLLSILVLALIGEQALTVGGSIVAALYGTLCGANVFGDHAKHKSQNEGD
jgi:hypothetical protein